jgi:putative SOS response-associated peptidase YedK
MCGRVVTTWNATRLAEYFEAMLDAESEEVLATPRYNVAPTSPLWTVVEQQGQRHLVVARWGLIPSWARDVSGAAKLINARAESLFDRPKFRPLLARHRCIVPVDGFYEWGPDREPRYIHARHDAPLEVAALWTTWRAPDEREVRSCTMLTASSIGELAAIHHRMPVALAERDRDLWLAPDPLHPDELNDVVMRARSEAEQNWTVHQVARAVNKVGVDEVTLVEAVGAEPVQGQLFGD